MSLPPLLAPDRSASLRRLKYEAEIAARQAFNTLTRGGRLPGDQDPGRVGPHRFPRSRRHPGTTLLCWNMADTGKSHLLVALSAAAVRAE